MKRISIVVLLITISFIWGCAPKVPKISDINKIEVSLFIADGGEGYEINGEITNTDDLEFITEALNSLIPSEPSSCPFDMDMRVYCADDTSYVYSIACDGCPEIRYGTQTNYRQYTFSEGHFYRFKEIIANALLETKQESFLERWKDIEDDNY